MDVREVIKRLRKERQLGPRGFAFLIGLLPSDYLKFENGGQMVITDKLATAIIDALGIPPSLDWFTIMYAVRH